ncbi:MAG: hypothetical protein R2713_23025 [Ilumatobacteraceae bacterium]
MTPRIGEEFTSWTQPSGRRPRSVSSTAIYPHLDHPMLPENT